LPAQLLELERPIPARPASWRTRLSERLQVAMADAPLIAPLGPGSASMVTAVLAGAVAVLGLVFAWNKTAPGPTAPAGGGLAPIAASPVPVSARWSRSRATFASVRPAEPVIASSPGGGALADALGEGLVGYWRFDERPGATLAPDLTGNGGDCALRRIDSTEWIDGELAGAIRLRGGGWLECPSTEASGRISTEITISAWVQRTEVQGNLRTIVARQHGAGNQDDFYLGFNRDRLVFGSWVWHTLYVHVPVTVDRWFHVAATRRKDGLLTVYVDGVVAGQSVPPPRYLHGTLATTPYANPMLVGAANNWPDPGEVNQKLKGAIDELAIYDRALEPAQIAALARRIQPRLH
jgi:hypothetical protein